MKMSSKWRTFLAAVGILFGLLGGLSMAQGRTEADWEKLFERSEYQNSSGATLKYRLLRPEKLKAGQRYPLVIFLHGAGERGDDNRLQLVHGMREFARADRRKEFPAFVLAPQCPSNQKWVDVPWDAPKLEQPEKPAKAMGLCLELIDKLQKDLPIDDRRLYLTGLSMGGFGTFDAIARWPDRFAAAMPICGGGDTRKETVSRYRDLPLWVFHGGKDTLVRPERSREIIAALKEAGAEPRYTEYPDAGHDSWTQTYADEAVFRWLFSQQRTAAGKADK
jgi:predicted peptidase